MCNRIASAVLFGLSTLVAGCATSPSTMHEYGQPEVLVAPSNFKGVHGLAVDTKGRLLAGSVIGSAIYEVDRNSGKASVFIPAPEGQADDIAIGPKGELAWTSFLQGVLRYRESDSAPIKVLAKDLPGINSLAFDQKNGRLYASQVFLGDALWEIDIGGQKPPRLIKKELGGLNGFEVGKDGWIYGPLWFKGQIVKVNPDSGEVKTLASGMKTPAAANFDSKGNLYAVDTKSGELVRIDPASGSKTTVAQLKSALDNLAIDKQDHIYVSNMADNSIEEVDPASGKSRYITKGEVAVPGGLKLSADGKTLYVADIFALRAVDTQTGKVTDIKRMQDSDLEYPFTVGASDKHLLLTSWFTSSLQIIDRGAMKTVAELGGFKAPTDAVELPDGSVLVSEIATGNLVRLNGDGYKNREVVLQGLEGPVQLILARDGNLYVTVAAGKLIRINTKDWSKSVVAEGLKLPEGLAETPNGRLIIAEAAARQLTEIDPIGGTRRVIAGDLPIGFEGGAGMPPSYIPTGVAIDARGNVYFSADRNNAIYRIPNR
ncbi:PQQ-binding-like beta-propeller repeat protein [Noviherbaspirillum sp.]|uniref:outer membrane protein assembly factor BamB family protein n=1 Tax=Noviherbaspirillum sp. TaxID=1926288 RepID=UPI0025DB5354|nr:PQQ-binding-like beta-propeller repeat protein [Noviherbaspirillum sp.]